MVFVSRQRLLAVATIALVATLLPASSSSALRAAPTPAKATITVKAGDSSFKLSAKTVSVGTVTFVVTNVGKVNHDFKINGKKTPLILPHKTVKLVVKFGKAGKFPYLSTVTGQASKGMSGFLTVKAPAATTTGDAALGKTVFQAHACAACHTLRAAGAKGTIGTDFDQAMPSYATIVNVVTNGKTGQLGTMSPYKGTLTTAEIQDVAAFIYASTHP